MKKVLKKAALATLGLSLVAGSAGAVSLSVMNDLTAGGAANVGPAYIANEAYNTSTVNVITPFGPNDSVGSLGMFVTTTGVNSPTKLVFSMDNADFTAADSTYYLYAWDDADNDGNYDIAELGLPIIGSTSNPVVGNLANGELTFVGPLSHNGGGLLAAGTRLVIGSTGTAATAEPTDGVNWSLHAGLSLDDSVTLTVVESGPFAGDQTASATIGQMVNQYTLCVKPANDVFDAVINLDSSPAKVNFLPAATPVLIDASTYTLTNRNEVNTTASVTGCNDTTNYFPNAGTFFLAQDTDDGSVVKIHGVLTSSVADQALQLGGDVSMKATIGATTQVSVPYTTSVGWVTALATDTINDTAGGTTTDFLFDATVDGSPIDIRTFGFSVVSEPAANFYQITYALPTGVSAGAWTLGEGYDSIITYFPIGYPGYNAFLKATNRFNETATMALNATCENTTDGVQMQVNGTLANVPANNHVTFTSGDIVTALGLDGTKAYQCAIEVVSNAPAALMQVSGIQIGPDGRTALPLYNIANTNLSQ